MALPSMEDRLLFSVLFNVALVLVLCFGLAVWALRFFEPKAFESGVLDLRGRAALEEDEGKVLPQALEMSLHLAALLKPFLNSMTGHFKREERAEGERDPLLFKNTQRLVENARKFILDFIEYAQPGTALNMEEKIDLKQFLEDLLQSNEIHQKRPKHLLQEVLWPQEEPFKIKGSRDGLRKSLSHVLINAYESVRNSQARPQVRIQVRKKFFLGRRPYAAITISDNGEGIALKNIKKVFNPFFSRRIGGLRGMGLAYAKKMIEAHKGQIEIKSVVGKGVEVLIQLPLQRDFLPPFKGPRFKASLKRKAQEKPQGKSKGKKQGKKQRKPQAKPTEDPGEKSPPPAA